MSDSDNNYSSDDERVSKDHKKLLQAVGNLSKVQHIKKVARKEASVTQNEFDLIKPRVELPKKLLPIVSSVDVSDLVKTLKGTTKHQNVGKELKQVKNSTKVLLKPLEKPEAERVIRTINYEKTKKQLQRWDAVVAQFQSAETQTFPLDSETVYINTSRFKKPLPMSLKSELEIAVEEAEDRLRELKGKKKDVLTDNDERMEKMILTKEEIKKRRQELLYLKMRQSQKSAKLRLQNKIKSKKYHRLLKQQKLKHQLKEFELLQKQNPEEAMEKLKSLEKNRILERANLRHKNTGTWAKNNLVKAKYNRDVQKDLSEQLALSRQLTEKKDVSDDDEVMKSDDDVPFDMADQSNPWMRSNAKKGDAGSVDSLADGYRKYWMTRNENEQKLNNHRADLAEDTIVTDDGKEEDQAGPLEKSEPVKVKKNRKLTKKNMPMADANNDEDETKRLDTTEPLKTKKNKKRNKKDTPPTIVVENGWIVEDVQEIDSEANIQTINNLFDKAEENVLKNLEKKQLKRKMDFAKKMTKVEMETRPLPQKNELKNLQDLSFKNKSIRIEIDEQLLETAGGADPVLPATVTTTPAPTPRENLSKDVIKHDNYADVKPKKLKTSLVEMTTCGEDLDFDDIEDSVAIDRQTTISDAFEDDDIVAEFRKEKSAQEKNALADQLTLSMPGWGSWAGTGISKNSNKAKKLVLQFESTKAATDGNKNPVRINETVSKKMREHLVSDIPFPFTSVKDYEASIRAPLGRSFIPETAFRMLTRPAVITRRGQIIKPMDESELVKPVRRPRSVVEKRILYDAKVAT